MVSGPALTDLKNRVGNRPSATWDLLLDVPVMIMVSSQRLGRSRGSGGYREAPLVDRRADNLIQ